MSIVTRTGDKGETGLFGGERTSKASARIHAIGTVDEVNAVIGLALARDTLSPVLRHHLIRTQHDLFRVGADLSTPLGGKQREKRIESQHVQKVELWIEGLEKALPPQTGFILPGGSASASLLHLARTVCRRAERWIVSLSQEEKTNDHVRIYMNRLSDYLFLAARKTLLDEGGKEIYVEY